MSEEQVKYQVNVVKGGQTALPLMAAFGVGMMVMFTLISLGAGVFIILAATLLSCALVMGVLIYRGTYTLDEKGIHEVLIPFWSPFNWRKPEEHFFTWKQVRAYKVSMDLPKGGISFRDIEQKVILDIYFHGTSYKIIFNNGKTTESRASFGKFAEAFIAKVEEINEARLHAEPIKTAQTEVDKHILENEEASVIERKPSFYERPIAKVVSLIFVAATIGLMYVMFQGYGSESSWFRLIFVLGPGTAYMCYRSFYRPRWDK